MFQLFGNTCVEIIGYQFLGGDEPFFVLFAERVSQKFVGVVRETARLRRGYRLNLSAIVFGSRSSTIFLMVSPIVRGGTIRV